MDQSDCIICISKTSYRNPNIKCQYCDFVCCRNCCETYIIDQKSTKCMDNSCKKEWTRKFLVDNFTKTFQDKWKKTKEEVLYDNEVALLPATQSIAQQRQTINNIKQEIRDNNEMIYKLRRINNENQNKIYRLDRIGESINNERRVFTRPCPQEECRGYLSTQWKCGTCEKWTCSKCHCIKGDRYDSPHVCDPNNVETAKLLNSDTKPCPKCSTGIYKIDGCDQMWCTQCHTGFSWRTGAIQNNIHNPHYFEWARRCNNGLMDRNIGDIQCGRELTHRSVHTFETNVLESIFPKLTRGNEPTELKNSMRIMKRIIIAIIHLRHEDLPLYEVPQHENNLELRVRYLQHNISKQDFKIKLQQANKKHEKKREIGQILDMYIQSTTDIIIRAQEHFSNNTYRNAHVETTMINDINNYIEEVNKLNAYVNICLKTIFKTYGSKCKQIYIVNDGHDHILR